jgi:adenylate cyclase
MGFRPATTELKEETLRVVRQAVALDPKDEYSLLHLAMVLIDFTGNTGEAMVLLRRTLEINPNFSLGYGLIGDVHLVIDQPDEAIRNAEISIRLNPRDPGNFYRYDTLAMASLQKGDGDKALHWASQQLALKPDFWSGYAVTTAVLAGKGELDQARRSAEALKKCRPGVSIAAIKAALAWNDSPWRKRYFENLIAAGIPE